MTSGAGRHSRDQKARLDRAVSEQDRVAAQAAHEVASRAIRRLDILEGVMIGGGAVLALIGGGLVAGLMAGVAGLTFRTWWMIVSLVLFVVPGGIAIMKIRRDERADARARTADTTNER